LSDRLKHSGYNLRLSPFARNLARLSGATTLGGLIALAASPIIARLYPPSEFGVLGVFATTLSLVIVVASLRYDLAIPYPHNEREAASVLVLALLTIVLTSVACAIAVAAGVPSHLPAIKDSLVGGLAWWLPVGMWASATYAALSIWMIRRRDFGIIGTTKIAQGALQAGSQILLGVARVGSSGLIVGQIVGSSGGLVRLLRQIRKESSALFHGFRLSEMRAAALAYKRFPLYSTPAVLLDSATGAMPLFFIAAHFGSVPAGLYTLVQRVFMMPFALLTVNLGQLVFGDLAEARRSDPASLTSIFRRRVLQVAVLGLIVLIPLLLIVPWVVPRIFGERWTDAGVYFLILAPMTYAGFISSPFGFVIDVVRRQDLHLLRDTVRSLFIGGALALSSALHNDARRTLVVISVAGTINGIFYLFISWRAISSHVGSVEPSASSPIDSAFLAEPRA
jgi:O-antigen/teichoic acid export membrane protein